MLIRFDKDKLAAQVLCGLTEDLPKEQLKEINVKLELLRSQVLKFQDEQVRPQLEDIERLIKDINRKFDPRIEAEEKAEELRKQQEELAKKEEELRNLKP